MEKSAPLIIVGPPGCGKGEYIKQLAENEGRVLLRCFCRKDRTLRESRAKLHEWAFRREESLVWLEGTDDLTPEAQSFLRRILETYSSSVKFCLECREIERLQEPIRSRCEVIKITYNCPNKPSDFIEHHKIYTWRQQTYYNYIKNNPILLKQYLAGVNKVNESDGTIENDMLYAVNPMMKIYDIFYKLTDNNLKIFITRALLMRSNPWCILAYISTLNEPNV